MTSAADTTEALVTADTTVALVTVDTTEALVTVDTMEALVTVGTRWVTAARLAAVGTRRVTAVRWVTAAQWATAVQWARAAGIAADKQRLLSAGKRVCVRQPCLSLPLVSIRAEMSPRAIGPWRRGQLAYSWRSLLPSATNPPQPAL